MKRVGMVGGGDVGYKFTTDVKRGCWLLGVGMVYDGWVTDVVQLRCWRVRTV